MPSNNGGRRGAGRQDRGMMIVTSRPLPAQSAEAVVVIAEAFVDAHNDTSNLNNTISQQKAELKKVRADKKKLLKTIKDLEKVAQEASHPDRVEAEQECIKTMCRDLVGCQSVMEEAVSAGLMMKKKAHKDSDLRWAYSVTEVTLNEECPDGRVAVIKLTHPIKDLLRLFLEQKKQTKMTKEQAQKMSEKIKKLEKFIEDCSKEQDEVNANMAMASKVILEENKKLKDFCATLITKTTKKDLFEACADYSEESSDDDITRLIFTNLTHTYDSEFSCACVS